jgi:hypothetical protein
LPKLKPKLNLKYPDLLQLFGALAVKQRSESRQFLAWFLQHYYHLDETDVDDTICDGHEDKTTDGIYVNEQSGQVHVFQSKISKGPKTLGDSALKEFYGALTQFQSKAAVQTLQAATINKELAALLRDLEIAEKVEKGYEVKGIFVTNSTRDHNAIEYLKVAKNLILYDALTLEKLFVPIDKTEPIEQEISFDVSAVPILDYPIGPSLKMTIAPVAASELIAMPGISNGELFAYNVRQWLRRTKVNDDIAASINVQDEHKFFPAFHNGVTVLCKKLDSSKDKIRISGYAVVNGCQSLSGLYENKGKISSDLRILTKFIQTPPTGPLAAKITDHTNNQNGTTARDLQSNNLIQTRLQTEINSGGEFCYRIKRGEHLDWPDAKVIENDLAARLLLAFDLKEPWSCHQTYKLFDERHSDIFAQQSVTGNRIITIYQIYKIVVPKLGMLSNKLFGGYKLTHFLVMYLMREALETDTLGKQFCANPEKFISTKSDVAKLLTCIDRIAQTVIRALDNEVKRKDADLLNPFDFKRDLKSPNRVRLIETNVITTYQVLIDNAAAVPFTKQWLEQKVVKK